MGNKIINQGGRKKEDWVFRGQNMEGLKIQTEEFGMYIANDRVHCWS